MEEWTHATKWIEQAPLVGVMAAIIFSGIKAYWVPGFAYREKTAERDRALATLDRFVGIHEAQTRAMEDIKREMAEQKVVNTELCKEIERLTDRLERRGTRGGGVQ